jgi:hypothetical protein
LTAYLVGYRLRVYAPRSVDLTEATVLVPSAGAPHSDAFQVTTLNGIAGYQPYLDLPTGRNGKIDPLNRELATGEWTFPLIDRSIAGSNLKRWMTAFLGNLKGQPRFAGLRCEVDETLDNGATWTRWRTGRVTKLAMGPVVGYLSLREVTDEAKMPVFIGNPHSSITYAARQALCPIGLMGSDYGTIKAIGSTGGPKPLTGTAKTITVNAANQLASVYVSLSMDATSATRKDNIVTKQLVGACAPGTPVFIPGTVLGGAGSEAVLPNFSGPLRARVKHTSGANSGLTGDYYAAGLGFGPGPNGKFRLVNLALKALPTGDVSQLATPADGVTVEVTLWTDDKVSKDNPLFINDVHFAQLLKDMGDGKFGYLYRVGETKPAAAAYGDAKRTVTITNAATFIADTTYPVQRFIVTDSDEFIRWTEKNALKPLNVALYPDVNGGLVLLDMRLPTSLAGIPALAETDLARDHEQGDWEFDRENVITRVDFTRYTDTPVKIADLEQDSATYPDIPTGGVETFDHPLLVLDVGSTDIGDKSFTCDAPGFRSMPGETLQGQPRATYLENKLVETANQWRRPAGWGFIELPVTLTRSGTAITMGGLVTATFQHVPDPTTWQRGGTRVCRVLELSPLGPVRTVRLLDLGFNLFAVAPTLAAPAQEAGNTYTGVTSALTINASGQAAEVRYAVTDTSVGTVPVDSSPLWTVFGRFTTTQTVTIRGLAPNRRVWVQGRTLPDYVDSYLPSAWANAAGTGRVDTAALPAPSAPASSLITGKGFRVSWTNGAADLATELLLATPTSDPRVVVMRLPPGATFFDFPGDTGVDIQLSTQYRVGVRHAGTNIDGYSAEVTVDVTTTGTATVAPATGGFVCIVGVP